MHQRKKITFLSLGLRFGPLNSYLQGDPGLKQIVRRQLRSLLRLYVRNVPFNRGKGRLLRSLAPIAGDGDELIPVTFDQNIHVELDITEHIQSWIFYFGYYEKQVTKYICSQLHPGMDFVDIGANIGYYTLIAAKRLFASDRVHAFEPDNDNFERLKRNVELNEMTNVELNRLAVSNSSGRATFYSSNQGRNRGIGGLRQTEKGSQVAVTCKTVRLDEYFSERFPSRLNKVGLVKIDIEGAEFLALQGAQSLLENRPVLVIEACDVLTQRFGYTTLELRQWLRQYGYRFHRLANRGLQEVTDGEQWLNAELVCLPG